MGRIRGPSDASKASNISTSTGYLSRIITAQSTGAASSAPISPLEGTRTRSTSFGSVSSLGPENSLFADLAVGENSIFILEPALWEPPQKSDSDEDEQDHPSDRLRNSEIGLSAAEIPPCLRPGYSGNTGCWITRRQLEFGADPYPYCHPDNSLESVNSAVLDGQDHGTLFGRHRQPVKLEQDPQLALGLNHGDELDLRQTDLRSSPLVVRNELTSESQADGFGPFSAPGTRTSVGRSKSSHDSEPTHITLQNRSFTAPAALPSHTAKSESLFSLSKVSKLRRTVTQHARDTLGHLDLMVQHPKKYRRQRRKIGKHDFNAEFGGESAAASTSAIKQDPTSATSVRSARSWPDSASTGSQDDNDGVSLQNISPVPTQSGNDTDAVSLLSKPSVFGTVHESVLSGHDSAEHRSESKVTRWARKKMASMSSLVSMTSNLSKNIFQHVTRPLRPLGDSAGGNGVSISGKTSLGSAPPNSPRLSLASFDSRPASSLGSAPMLDWAGVSRLRSKEYGIMVGQDAAKHLADPPGDTSVRSTSGRRRRFGEKMSSLKASAKKFAEQFGGDEQSMSNRSLGSPGRLSVWR